MEINLFTSVAALLFAGTAACASPSIAQPQALTAPHAREAIVTPYKALEAGKNLRVVRIGTQATMNSKRVQSYALEDFLIASSQVSAQ